MLQFGIVVKCLLTDEEEYHRMAESCNPYGDGHASERILQAILYHYGFAKERPESFRSGV